MANHDAHMTLGTKVGFILGWLFFGLAFMLAAAESAVGHHFITSTNDLLLTLTPSKWIILKHKLASPLFDMVAMPLLQLPGWLLAGLPAGVLLWRCRPHREEMDPNLLNSLTTFDRLADLAEEEGALNDDPTFNEFDMRDYDDEVREDLKTAKDYMDNWHPHDNDSSFDEPSQTLGPEEKMQQARDNLSIPFDKLS